NAFRVNVSKMRVQLPRSMREQLAAAIAPVTKLANDLYRGGDRSSSGHDVNGGRAINGKVPLFSKANGWNWQLSPPGLPARLSFPQAVGALLSVATGDERRIIRRLAARLCAARSH